MTERRTTEDCSESSSDLIEEINLGFTHGKLELTWDPSTPHVVCLIARSGDGDDQKPILVGEPGAAELKRVSSILNNLAIRAERAVAAKAKAAGAKKTGW